MGEQRRSSEQSDEAGISDEDISTMREKPSRSMDAANGSEATTKVSVNEDYLFDVDIENRELGPAYWLGPIYAVRRGTWFFMEGSVQKPCDENLATQLEEGYIKTKPWRVPVPQPRSSSRPRPLSGSFGIGGLATPSETTPSSSSVSAQQTQDKEKDKASVPPPQSPALTHRLFGSHLNSFVTYQDATSAYIVADDFLSRMSGTVYQRFAGSAHYSGTKVFRGYNDPAAKKAKEAKQAGTMPNADARKPSIATLATDAVKVDSQVDDTAKETEVEERPESRLHTLERQMSSLITSAYENPAAQDEQARQREEDEIRDDYNNTPDDAQDREIEHLCLITHGIGQRLGARFETFNFVHDVNEMRKTLKAVYSAAPDLQALNSEVDKPQKNMRLQVLPVTWRHLLDFPKQSLKYNRKEHDLADLDADHHDEYPSLPDITIDGVPALRNIVSDLVLDILLYQTPAYKDHISRIVAQECNRVYKLFKERNPSFKGKVSLCGHSLGSAILFDLLSEQGDDAPVFGRSHGSVENADLKLDFEVEDLFCFGSPIGLFQMLKGKTIAGRENPNNTTTLDGSEEASRNPFQESGYYKPSGTPRRPTSSDFAVSAPKCKQLYNIFHPSDPISYRLEPLITPAMSALKPQPLPYTKKTLFGTSMSSTITGIPARMGQSVTGFLSSFGTGLATTFINKSLGITAEDVAKLHAPTAVSHQTRLQQTQGAGTGAGGGVGPAAQSSSAAQSTAAQKDRKRSQDTMIGEPTADHVPTLIDSEMETLFAGFQKRRKSNDDGATDFGTTRETEEKGRKLRCEEAKVRALNSNGRVDYSIQE